MHISEGILSPPVLAGGAALSAIGVGIGLAKMRHEDVLRASLISSAFFVAGLFHVPLGFTSVHLVLNGLVGLLLGWTAFPAILVALLLQALLFQEGGLTVLGVNTFAMALPAVICHYVFGPFIRDVNIKQAVICWLLAGAVGAVAIIASGILSATALLLSGKEFEGAARVILGAHAPLMVIEAFVTGSVVVFLKKVRPEIFQVLRRDAEDD